MSAIIKNVNLLKSFSKVTKNLVKRNMCVQQQPSEQQVDLRRKLIDSCRVAISGKIVREPRTNEKGNVFVTFETKTISPDRNNVIRGWHDTVFYNEFQRKLAQQIQIGNQIYLNAFIRHREEPIGEDGKKIRTGYQLIPTRIHLAPEADPPVDINEVFLFGQVHGEPHNLEKVTFLTVATRIFNNVENRNGLVFHSISLENLQLREVANQLKDGDLVHANGCLINRKRIINERQIREPIIFGTSLLKVK